VVTTSQHYVQDIRKEVEVKEYQWFKFSPADWLTDVELRSCSSAARGTLVDLMCIAHRNNRSYGTFMDADTMNGRKKVAKSLSLSTRTFDNHIASLLKMGRICIADDGEMYIKRMRDDYAKAQKDAQNGSKGGNPALSGVKPDKSKNKSKSKNRIDPPIIPAGEEGEVSFKKWDQKQFQASIIKANHDGILNKDECINFRDYWIEPSPAGRMKFSLEKTWDTRLRIHNAIRMVYSKQRTAKRVMRGTS
tara:strand:+ start:2699 stop:3442 length:744 start_codon:yes stop_codon:yes gene_type:complete